MAQETPVETGNDISKGHAYFNERMPKYGVHKVEDPLNQVMLKRTDLKTGKTVLVSFPIFSPVPDGIKIIVYTIDRSLVTYKGKEQKTEDGVEVAKRNWSKDYSITRLHTARINNKTGKDMKYNIPKDAGTHPFFPPQLVEKYDQATKIKTLVITEGYFKAFKAAQFGLDIVGLSSITHFKDKDTGGIHGDILKLINNCNVDNIIYLADGDCNQISLKAFDAGNDVWTRPNQFFTSAATFRKLLDDYNKTRFFSYIDSMNISNMPKGLDDLLIEMQGKEAEVVADILTLSQKQKYFITHDITAGVGKVYKDFKLKDVNEFVEFHSENIQRMARLTTGNENAKVPDLKTKEFVYCGTRYKWNDEKSNCEIVRPADANRYFRVGDQYHEKVEVPNKYGDLEKRFDRRMKSTIIDDQGKEIMQHIPKYFAFCNVPNHTNYQPVISGCYNMYFPFDHEPQEFESEEDFSYTMRLLEHIFGSRDVKVHHKTKGEIIVNELDLGLDFIQLLYQQPQQIMPILCLVSKEQGTGKSTFAFWLKELFTQNVAIVGNQDLANDFNAFWAGKLLIICDEAKIDKQVVVEKIKSLSTAKKITVNAKGKDQTEIDFFGKFLMLTNNEDNFIYAGEEDVRYWIRKVPVVKELFVDMLGDMKKEIPFFLNFLNKRKLKTENLHRAWFYPELIKTEALKKVVAFSKSTVEKEIRHKIRNMFLDHAESVIMMNTEDILQYLLRKGIEENYLERILKDDMKIERYHVLQYDGINYKTMEELTAAVPDVDASKIKKMGKTRRYRFPKWERTGELGKQKTERVYVECNGRPFIFHIEKFLLPEEITGRLPDPEAIAVAKMHDNAIDDLSADQNPVQRTVGNQTELVIPSGPSDDLPF